jgi:hypothetical protein
VLFSASPWSKTQMLDRITHDPEDVREALAYAAAGVRV